MRSQQLAFQWLEDFGHTCPKKQLPVIWFLPDHICSPGRDRHAGCLVQQIPGSYCSFIKSRFDSTFLLRPPFLILSPKASIGFHGNNKATTTVLDSTMTSSNTCCIATVQPSDRQVLLQLLALNQPWNMETRRTPAWNMAWNISGISGWWLTSVNILSIRALHYDFSACLIPAFQQSVTVFIYGILSKAKTTGATR